MNRFNKRGDLDDWIPLIFGIFFIFFTLFFFNFIFEARSVSIENEVRDIENKMSSTKIFMDFLNQEVVFNNKKLKVYDLIILYNKDKNSLINYKDKIEREAKEYFDKIYGEGRWKFYVSFYNKEVPTKKTLFQIPEYYCGEVSTEETSVINFYLPSFEDFIEVSFVFVKN